MKDRLEFRNLIQKYDLIDLIGDESEVIEWFNRVILDLAVWVGKREEAWEILQRFREEHDRRRKAQERFARAVEGQRQQKLEGGQGDGLQNPHTRVKFRQISI